VILDGRTVQSTPESGAAGYDGHKHRKGRKVHMAVDTLGYLLAAVITPANEQECAQVAELAALVQEVTGQTVELAYVDQGYIGDAPAEAAAAQGIQLAVIKLPDAQGPKKGFVFCRAAGWSSAVLPGWPVSGARRAPMNACPKP
jgi:transposase